MRAIAIIGTGASSVQFMPEIAPRAEHLTVFQRTPPWMGPTADYHDPVSDGQKWLFAHVPTYSEWNRFWIFWRSDEVIAAGRAEVDPEWDTANESVSMLNDFVRTMLASYLELQFHDRPDLVPHVVPPYPPVRQAVRARQRHLGDDVEARQRHPGDGRPSARSPPSGVVTADGVEHDVDVIIYGTGFQASKFLTPMRITGATASTCTSSGTATPAPTSGSRFPASRTSSACTGRTPTS